MVEKRVTVVFGSQTGSAEAIATEICDRLATKDFQYELFCLDEVAKKDLLEFFSSRELLVVVTSSTGDGDPPDNAAKFMRKLHIQDLPADALSRIRFALLGLGDSNYSTFHGCPKKLEKRLLALGARSFYSSGWADDATGLEEVAEPWIEGLPAAVTNELHVEKKADEAEESHLAKVISRLHLDSTNSTLPFESSFPAQGACLIRGRSELAGDEALRVPLLSKDYLRIRFTGKHLTPQEEGKIAWQAGSSFPGSAGGLRDVTLVELARMTRDGAAKDKFQMTIDTGPPLSEDEIEAKKMRRMQAMSIDNYEPGDAFYFVFPNPAAEVDYLLARLGLKGDEEVELSLAEGASKQYPEHLPARTTPSSLLTHCLDIRRCLGRPFLRMLAEHTEEESERRRLLELASSQGTVSLSFYSHCLEGRVFGGSKEMVEFVKGPGLSPLDLLHAFPSAKPPLHRLIGFQRIISESEHLPRLQPRPYSVSSARSVHGTKVRFAFSAVDIPAGDGRAFSRRGLATGYIRTLTPPHKVRVIFQEPKYFRLPSEPADKDLLLIGPGTGVTPFLSFLHHLRHLDNGKGHKGRRWLVYGSRQLNIDGIYLDEMESFEKDGTLDRLLLAESKPIGTHDHSEKVKGVYVQDAMKSVASELGPWLHSGGVHIYVCGDAKAMSRDVYNALANILEEHAGLESGEGNKFLMDLKQARQYVEDVWG